MDHVKHTASALAQLRKESLSIFNRIHSIAEDAVFVKQVHDHYSDFPLLPNMRCGAWYTDPEIVSKERAYFKSTDGHTNNWSFNLRRPNLHILPLIVEHAGLVLVDSTRAGKRIPDALSKTVPIWCAVVNRTISLNSTVSPSYRDTALYTPPGSVSPQEHSQIDLKLDGWASQLAASSYRLPKLDYPLRPIWITPSTTAFPSFPKTPDHAFYPIVCVSASKQVADGMDRRSSGFTYIQGSGDDHELWSMGLNPSLYWRHYDKIMSMGPLRLPDLVRTLVTDAASQCDDNVTSLGSPLGNLIKQVSGRISICSVACLSRLSTFSAPPNIAFLYLTPKDPSIPTWFTRDDSDAPRMLGIQTPDGKKGQHHFLTTVLPRSMPFVQHHLQNHRMICIACNTGTDISVGVGVAALALFFHPDGSLCLPANGRDDISKDVLKTRLQWIISSYPQANPSRATLKRVNDFLLSPLQFPRLDASGKPGHKGEVDE